MKKKIMFTGGHATPAFAVLDELIKRGYKEKQIIWVGEKFNQRGTKKPSPEFKTVTEQYKIKFINIHAGKLVRKWTRQTYRIGILEFLNLFIGFINAFFIVLNQRPSIVMSFGGFLAVPIVFWAKVFRIKIITHEQTIVTGLANKIIARFADKICITFEESKKYFDESKVLLTGNPIRKSIFKIDSDITKSFKNTKPILYITGGNQGANEINKRIFEIVPKLLVEFNIVHQTGNSTITKDYQKANEIKSELSNEEKSKYLIFEYIGSEMIGEVLNKSDIILSRAGANTTIEIMVLGKLAVLIPIPWTSHDEQTKNAKLLESYGIAKRLSQNDKLSSDDIYSALLEAKGYLQRGKDFKGQNLTDTFKLTKSKIQLHAAEKIVDLINQY